MICRRATSHTTVICKGFRARVVASVRSRSTPSKMPQSSGSSFRKRQGFLLQMIEFESSCMAGVRGSMPEPSLGSRKAILQLLSPFGPA